MLATAVVTSADSDSGSVPSVRVLRARPPASSILAATVSALILGALVLGAGMLAAGISLALTRSTGSSWIASAPQRSATESCIPITGQRRS